MFERILDFLYKTTGVSTPANQKNIPLNPEPENPIQKQPIEAPVQEKFDFDPSPNIPRRTKPDEDNYVALYDGLKELIPEFDTQLLRAIEHLVLHDPEVSQAVNNIVLLANTKLNFEITGVDDDKVQEIENFCYSEVNKWYASTGNPNDEKALSADLFVQLATEGCVSCEAILYLNPNEIKSIETIPFWQIKINRDEETGDFEYTQDYNTASKIELNRLTYKYSPLYTLPNSPYPVPPFLSALMSIKVERDLFNKLAKVIEKLPLTGFLSMLVEKPKIQQGETQAQYQERTGDILHQLSTGLRDIWENEGAGALAGWKDTNEITHHNVVQNMQNVETLDQIVEEKKFSGLLQNPFMFGRNYSVTETMANVIIQIQEAQIKMYQEKVASVYEYYLDLALGWAGLKTEGLVVKPYFSSAFPENEKLKAETFAKNAETYLKFYDKGAMTMEAIGQHLGIELNEPAIQTSEIDEKPETKEAESSENEPEEETDE